jgi:hypothetical protein
MYMLMTFYDHVARVTLLHTVAHGCTQLDTVIHSCSMLQSFPRKHQESGFLGSPLRRESRCSEVGACGYIASSNRRLTGLGPAPNTVLQTSRVRMVPTHPSSKQQQAAASRQPAASAKISLRF